MLTTTHPANAPLLHRVLGLGTMALGVVFGGMMALGIGPLIEVPPGEPHLIGYVLSGVALVEAAVALLVMKRRIPERRPGQSTQEYWANTDAVTKIMTVWFMLTGAAILGAMAFLMSGLPVAALVSALAIAMYWLNGPNAFGH